MAPTATAGEKLRKQIVEALAAVERAENHARVLTDDSRNTKTPLVRAAKHLRRASNELAAALRALQPRDGTGVVAGAARIARPAIPLAARPEQQGTRRGGKKR